MLVWVMKSTELFPKGGVMKSRKCFLGFLMIFVVLSFIGMSRKPSDKVKVNPFVSYKVIEAFDMTDLKYFGAPEIDLVNGNESEKADFAKILDKLYTNKQPGLKFVIDITKNEDSEMQLAGEEDTEDGRQDPQAKGKHELYKQHTEKYKIVKKMEYDVNIIQDNKEIAKLKVYTKYDITYTKFEKEIGRMTAMNEELLQTSLYNFILAMDSYLNKSIGKQ